MLYTEISGTFEGVYKINTLSRYEELVCPELLGAT